MAVNNNNDNNNTIEKKCINVLRNVLINTLSKTKSIRRETTSFRLDRTISSAFIKRCILMGYKANLILESLMEFFLSESEGQRSLTEYQTNDQSKIHITQNIAINIQAQIAEVKLSLLNLLKVLENLAIKNQLTYEQQSFYEECQRKLFKDIPKASKLLDLTHDSDLNELLERAKVFIK